MLKTLSAALAASVLIAVASAPAAGADLYDPPVIKYDPPAQKVSFGGWYLRGHIGMSNQRFRGLDYFRFDNPDLSLQWLDRGGFASAPIFGGGVGYAFNSWLRADVTAEYRGKSSFSALDRYEFIAGPAIGAWGTNQYTAKKSEWLLLANAYADLGTFHGITPYVGAGIGTSRNTISHFNDTNVITNGGGYAGAGTQWQLAWALHAGVGYDVTERTTIDLGYSYVNLGNATTGQAFNYSPDPAFSAPNDGFKFRGLHSHDLKLGIRYKLN